MSPKDFIMGISDKSIKPILNSCSSVHDPFMGGKEKVLSMTSRPVNKFKNISDVEFSSVISKDPFQYKKNHLSSLRSQHNINGTIVQSGGITADISSFVKQRKSMNISKSLSKLIDSKQPVVGNNETINDIIGDFGQTAGKSFQLKSQLQGTTNKKYTVNREFEDRDIMDLLTKNKKIYHMSAYDVVKEPEIVLKHKKIHQKELSIPSGDFSRQLEIEPRSNALPAYGLYASKNFDLLKNEEMMKQLIEVEKQEQFQSRNVPDSPMKHISINASKPLKKLKYRSGSVEDSPLEDVKEDSDEEIYGDVELGDGV